MFFSQGNKNRAQEIRTALERSFDCPLDFMVRNYDYSWMVYSVQGTCCKITDEIANYLSQRESENPRINKIIFTQSLTTTWFDEANAYTYANRAIEEAWKINTEWLYGNWNLYVNGCDFIKDAPLESKQKVNWKKLRLLYWAYFLKHKEKAF